MGRITLPRKISIWTIVKLFMVSALTFTGYYFYPTLVGNKNNSEAPDDWSQVLASTTLEPVTLYKIDDYILKNTKRNECYLVQPYMDFSCLAPATPVFRAGDNENNSSSEIDYTRSRALLSSGGLGGVGEFISQQPKKDVQLDIPEQIKYYGNPVLEEIDNKPILAYYGGFHEIVLDTPKQRVVTFSRSYRTDSNEYTAGCVSSWFPSSIAKKDNIILFGGGGLESLFNDRCYNRKDRGGGEWGGKTYNGYTCAEYASKVGIPTNPSPGCRVTATESCWVRNSQCKTLFGGGTQYQNYPNITKLTIDQRPSPDRWGSSLFVSSQEGNQGPNSGGATARDAYTFCFGKTKDNCSRIKAALQYGDDLVLRMTDISNNKYAWTNRSDHEFAVFYPRDWVGRPMANPQKIFTRRVFYGQTSALSLISDWSSSGISFNYGGYDSPYSAYILPNKIDLFYKNRVVMGNLSKGEYYYKYYIDQRDVRPIALPDRMEIGPATSMLQNPPGKGYYVSDKYYFILEYYTDLKILKLTRFKVTGYYEEFPTEDITLTLNNIDLTYYRNISFSVNSADDLDIMIAPNYAESATANSSYESRMFRASKFNTTSSNVSDFKFYELNETNGGYKFENIGTTNNTPLTFRYYNNTDKDLSNDYAIFVSRNYVFSSKVPYGVDCTPNFNLAGGGLSLINTSPNSLNFGIAPTPDLSSNTGLYDLNFAFRSAVNLSCPSEVVPLPAGTKMSLKLFDGITSSPLPTTLSANLLSDRKSFNFNDVTFTNFKKYYYQVSFTFNGQTYNYPSSGIDTNRYFTLESFLNVYTYLDGEFPEPLPNTEIVVTKTFKNVSTQFSSPIADSQFSLLSSIFPDFYWDHNMTKVGTSLVDSVNYKLCFTNTPDTKVTRIGFTGVRTTSVTSISNNYLTGTLNNGCINLNYKSNSIAAYNVVPQEIDVYLTTTTIPDPSTYVNFRANGNVMIKNTSTVKSYSTTGNDKKYQGSYLASSSVGDKGYVMSLFNRNTYFNIPYYGKLTSAYNFSWTQDLIYFTEPTSSTFKETGTYLLTDRKTDVSASNFDKIDVFTNYQSYTPTIIYVAKNKVLYFDLTDTNIFTSLENTYFVSTDKSNTKERIVFNINCDDANYSLICNQNYEYHLKGGIYGDFKLTGKLNARNATRSFITIHQNPEILILLQKDLRSNKIFNVTRSKTIFKYLND